MHFCAWFRIDPCTWNINITNHPTRESRPLETTTADEWAAGPRGWEPELSEGTGMDWSLSAARFSGVMSLPLISSVISASESESELSESEPSFWPSSSSSQASSSSSPTAWSDWCNNLCNEYQNSVHCFQHKGSAIQCASELPFLSAIFLLISSQTSWSRGPR